MTALPAQALAIVAVILVERLGLAWITRRRPPGRTLGGHVTATIWFIAFVAVLLGALRRSDAIGTGWSSARFGSGLVLLVVGATLRLVAVSHLGRHFDEMVVIREGHRVIRSGPYGILRHPMHAGLVVMILGLAVLCAAWWAWALAAASGVNALAREVLEERALEAALGEAYAEHRRRTWGLTDLLPSRIGRVRRS